MTRVDFYISDSKLNCFSLACKIAEKAYINKVSLYINTESLSKAEELNQLLWTFKKNSFIPHALAGTLLDESPIHIGYGEPDLDSLKAEMLLNLSEEVPLFFSSFTRLAEVIGHDNKAAGRVRYKFYKDRGYSLNVHKLD